MPGAGSLHDLGEERFEPPLVVTAKGGEADVVTGLEIGAADHITKPFSPRILTARIRALFRSLKQEASDKSTHIIRGDVEIDLRKHTVHVKGAPFQLTYTEFEILVLLAIVVLQSVVLLSLLLTMVAYLLYADRKIWAAVQMRRGPNVVGPWGILQSFAVLSSAGL